MQCFRLILKKALHCCMNFRFSWCPIFYLVTLFPRQSVTLGQL